MGNIKYYKILTIINIISIFTTFVIVWWMLIESLLAAPMLGWSAWSTWWWWWTYANDWGTDTTNWKKWWIFVVATPDVSSDASADIWWTNYRHWTFMKYNMINRASSAGCKQIMMPYSMFAKNYTNASYDKLRMDGNSLISIDMRQAFRNSNNNWDWWFYEIWSDWTNDWLLGKWSDSMNWSNTYRSSRHNWSRRRSMTLNNTSWGTANYGFSLVCKK